MTPAAAPTAPHLVHVFPTFGPGGREMRAVELMGMMPAGVRHTVVALDGSLDSMARVPAGTDCRAVASPGGGGLLDRLRAMRRFLREQEPDVVLTYNWGAIEWVVGARSLRLPIVHHEDGFGPDEAGRQIARRVWLRRLALRKVVAIAVPSWQLFELARDLWHLPPKRLLYLPNGVDVERFRPVDGDRAGGEVVFVCVGGVRPEKNQALAVEAFARASCRDGARLRIVGDGPELAAVRALAERLGVAGRVDFAGAVADTAPEYRRADVFVIPSKTEQMPLALLEAMASGLPAVATDVGDVRRMVAPENDPWIVARDDAAALARAMDLAAKDPGARRTIGARNRARAVEQFEKQACYGRYVELYLRAARRA